MKNIILSAITILVATGLTLVGFEGIRSLTKGGKPHVSLTYRALTLANLAGSGTTETTGAYAAYFADASELAALVPLIRDEAVGLGNVPFGEVRTEEAAINTVTNGCPALKPNLRKTAFFLRTPAFNPFDPPTVFFDQGKALSPKLADFFDRYGERRVTMTTNEAGERTTLPPTKSAKKVLVAGDSVAFGAMIDDSETIASQLQRHDPEREYVNLGVGGADAEAIVCRLEDVASRYAGTVDEILYVYSENDLHPDRPYGTSEALIGWLKGFAASQGIAKVTVVFAPYIYLASPQTTRFNGYRGGDYPYRGEERLALRGLVESAGFRWIDLGEMYRQAVIDGKSQFAFFSLYADHAHLSPVGVRRFVDVYRAD